MHVAGHRADLGVAVSGQRLLDEIDKSRLALERGQKRDRIAANERFGGRGLFWLRRGWTWRRLVLRRAVYRPVGQSPL